MPAGASLYDAMAALFMSKASYYAENPPVMALLERAQLEQSAEVRQDIVTTLKQLAVTMLQKRVEFSRPLLQKMKLFLSVVSKGLFED